MLAAEHVGLDFLGFSARLELTRALGIAGLACALGVGKLETVGGAHFVVLEAAVQGAQVIVADVIGLVIEVQTTTGALAADVVIALFEGLQARAVPVAAGLDVVGAEVALLPAQCGCHAEVVDAVAKAETVACRAGKLGAGLAGVLVVAGFAAAGIKQAFVIEGRQALDIDGAAQRVGVHVRRQGFDHRQGLHQFGRQNVQRHGAAATFRGGHQRAVDGHAVQVGGQATNGDEAPFALIPRVKPTS